MSAPLCSPRTELIAMAEGIKLIPDATPYELELVPVIASFVRDVEKYDDMQRLSNLPHVRESFQVGARFLPTAFFTDAELRQAATAQGAEILIVYTFDSRYSIDNYYQTPGMLLLDVRPDRVVRMTVNADAAVLDARTGQVLGRFTASQSKDELAATWSSDENAQQYRRIAEAKAFTDMVTQIQKQWKNVVGP